MPKQPKETLGFTAPFGQADQVAGNDYYDRAAAPAWEYDAGRRGKPDWQRYPARIDASLESMAQLGAPVYMYTPGNPAVDGMFEHGRRSSACPASAASNHVQLDQMLEKEVYSGATRKVRRNGVQKRPEPMFDLGF